MGNKKTSKKRKESKPIILKEYIPFNDPDFKNVDTVFEVLIECLKEEDLDSFRDVLFVHLMTVNKMELAKKAGIGRRTIYDLLDPKKEFNPELKTIAALFKALAA